MLSSGVLVLPQNCWMTRLSSSRRMGRMLDCQPGQEVVQLSVLILLFMTPLPPLYPPVMAGHAPANRIHSGLVSATWSPISRWLAPSIRGSPDACSLPQS
ncbi:hypothetical protein L209DRAFT_56757 [Thermothelomyces heterothallicus CBS 203.75]